MRHAKGGGVFSVSVKEGSGYTVQGIDADGYKEGDEVSFTVNVTDGAKQIKQVLKDEEALTAKADGSYQFTMPAKNVEISVVLENKTPTVSLSVSSIVLNARTADSATITATVTSGYEIEWNIGDDEVATITANGNSAEVTAVAKGKTNISVSIKGIEGIAASSAVSVVNTRAWAEAEENAMKDNLYGVVLKPVEQDDMVAVWDASHNQITVEGAWIEGDVLAEYAEQYTADKDWVNVTHLYSVTEGTAYMFEKAVEVSGDTRYVRVFIYATEDAAGDILAKEGKFFITAYDPYVYEWPAAYLSDCLKAVLSTAVIPSVSAHHYYLNNYSVTAYYESAEADGGYGAILTAAGYTVKAEDGYYSAVSPDEMFGLAYIYKNGALEITITYYSSSAWAQTAVANAFNYYSNIQITSDVTAFELPEFEGEGVSFTFADGKYNKYWLTEGRERDIYGTITVKDSTAALHAAYLEKLEDNGWIAVGTSGMYVKPIAESEQVNKIRVTFSAKDNSTSIEFYYFSIKDPTNGWSIDIINDNVLLFKYFSKYMTDTIPEYTDDIVGFSADKDSVYITVPEEDFEGIIARYAKILVKEGYTDLGQYNEYVSPNGQFSIKLSTPPYSYVNTLCLYITEKPTQWNNERIKDGLQLIGTSIESIPLFESETSFGCTYSIKNDYSTKKDYLSIVIKPIDSKETIAQADFNAYKAKLVADADWTQVTEGGNKFVASDGTTITLSYSSYSGITIDIKYVAA